MTNEKFAALFGGPARTPEAPIGRREMDLARSIQAVTEEIMMKMARYARAITGKPNLCLAGGVALNCVSNGKLLRVRNVRRHLDPARLGRRRRIARRRAVCLVRRARQTSQGRRHARRHEGRLPRPSFTREDIKAFLDGNTCPTMRCPDRRAQPAPREGARQREGRRPAPGPHGVRPARAGRPLDPRRRAQPRRCSRV